MAFFTSPAWGPAARAPLSAPAALHAMLRPGPAGRGLVMSMDSRFLLLPGDADAQVRQDSCVWNQAADSFWLLI